MTWIKASWSTDQERFFILTSMGTKLRIARTFFLVGITIYRIIKTSCCSLGGKKKKEVMPFPSPSMVKAKWTEDQHSEVSHIKSQAGRWNLVGQRQIKWEENYGSTPFATNHPDIHTQVCRFISRHFFSPLNFKIRVKKGMLFVREAGCRIQLITNYW